jgi:HlyD family secretion protein
MARHTRETAERSYPACLPRVLALAVLCSTIMTGCGPRSKGDGSPDTFAVRRGPVDVTVTESGSLKAGESIVIKNEVRRPLKILDMVDEGTVISRDDVEAGKILVKLDASELEDQHMAAESEVASARASLTEAEEGLLIQKSQNESSIRQAELDYAFALTDFRKLVGDTLALRYADQDLGPEQIAALLEDPEIGGQAEQKLRSYVSDIELKKQQLALSDTKYKWTVELFEKGYATESEKNGDELAVRQGQLALETAESNLELFKRYDFPKDFQKQASTVFEAREKIEREQAMARSRLAQNEANLSSRRAGLKQREEKLRSLAEDIENATIRATQPGMVVFEQPPPWRNEGPLKVGSQVQPNQAIFQFPDVSELVVAVTIHESEIDLIVLGQKAVIKMDAVPGTQFQGEVTKKSIVPSPQHGWLNPDLKVYDVEVTLIDDISRLRPAMTATVEILVERIEDVLHVPIQAVQTNERSERFCYRSDGTRVPVTIGKHNQVFTVVTEGLSEGETILMTPPELRDTE